MIPWGNLFLQVIAQDIAETELPPEKDDRDQYPWIKAKKWSLANLNRLFSRCVVCFNNNTEVDMLSKQA